MTAGTDAGSRIEGGTVIDDPAVVAAVLAEFEAYEVALIAGDTAALMAFFWTGPDVVRYGVADEEWGTEELLAFRLANPGVWAGRELSRTRISTFGADTAIVSTLFTYPDNPKLGRQSQTWRLIDGSWRIVNAHVSER
jgi:hypothetical protein